MNATKTYYCPDCGHSTPLEWDGTHFSCVCGTDYTPDELRARYRERIEGALADIETFEAWVDELDDLSVGTLKRHAA